MIEKLILVSLGAAGLVHVLHNGLIFAWLKTRIARYGPPQGAVPGTFLQWLATGFNCAYCFAHWTAGALALAAAASVQEWILLTCAGAWLANHSLGIYNLLSTTIWKAIDAWGANQFVQAKQIDPRIGERAA